MTQSNRKIAITGGIGSGKSTVAALLKNWGYAVFSCDEINRQLWQDEEYLKGLALLFPDCVVRGAIDKQRLNDLVFHDSKQLERLNGYAHPRIMQKLNEQMQLEIGLVFAEVPLLFEGGYQDRFDDIIVVIRHLEQRIDSVMARDNVSREDVLARIEHQISYQTIPDCNPHLLDNSGSREELTKNLQRILTQELKK